MFARLSSFVRASPGRRLLRGVLAVLCALGVWQAAAVTQARAATRLTVCAQSLYVRDSPEGIVIGTLYSGQTMNVDHYSPSGQWAYGFAYGQANKNGWVQNGWFCK